MVPSKPLMLCSAISDANMGTTTDAAPHAAPAINRAKKILSMEKLDCVTWMGKKMLVDGQVLASNFFRFQMGSVHAPLHAVRAARKQRQF
ncbi:uncharacterized protein LOC143903416 isoform X2 [Temnothorax americanus]|uniref:uncharacterized protein LOC143903416 isoform X2 n=1 Tax=Temnothorax americanus TaxID=1964332 RepID=UPI004067F120